MFQFKQFTIQQDRSAMKVTTDGCLFGSWAAKMTRDHSGSNEKKILDIGTGTGLLSLLMAQHLPLAMIDAIEIESGAFQQSKENFSASPWGDRLNALLGDARNYRFTGRYDVIISNPPFYEREWSSDDPGRKLAHHESGLLLGELLQVIRENISAEGTFYLLLPYKRKDEIRKLLTNAGLSISSLMFVKQTPKHDYFRILLEGKPGTAEEEILFDEMTIKDENDQYSCEFVSLLKDYYLYL